MATTDPMEQLKADYRGHVVIASASGYGNSQFYASYTVWKIEPNNSYRGILQGTVDGLHETPDEAHAAAMSAGRVALDAVLDR